MLSRPYAHNNVPNQPHLLNKYQINMGFSCIHGIWVLLGINVLAPYRHQVDVMLAPYQHQVDVMLAPYQHQVDVMYFQQWENIFI